MAVFPAFAANFGILPNKTFEAGDTPYSNQLSNTIPTELHMDLYARVKIITDLVTVLKLYQFPFTEFSNSKIAGTFASFNIQRDVWEVYCTLLAEHV